MVRAPIAISHSLFTAFKALQRVLCNAWLDQIGWLDGVQMGTFELDVLMTKRVEYAEIFDEERGILDCDTFNIAVSTPRI